MRTILVNLFLLFAGPVLAATPYIQNSDIKAGAAIDFSKLAPLPVADILVGSAGNVATPVVVTGNVTISNAGVTTIGAAQVTNAMLAGSIDLTTKVTGVLPVPNGGTGNSTLAIHGVLIGNTASPVNVTTPGTAGQILTSNGAGADPTFQSPASGGTVTSVSVVTANGLAGTVANPTTTPAITLSTSVTGALKGNGTAISAITYKQENPAGVVDGVNVTFTLSSTPISGASVILWSDASPMRQGIDYTIAGVTITYTVAPATGTDVYAYYPN